MKPILSVILPGMFTAAHLVLLTVLLPSICEWYIFIPLSGLLSALIYNTLRWVYGNEVILTVKTASMSKEEFEALRKAQDEH